MGTLKPKLREEIRAERLPTMRVQRGDITVAVLWPKSGLNLGTLIRTMDAINGKLVVPAEAKAMEALRRGNTIGMHNSPVIATPYHPMEYLHAMRVTGCRVVGVELAHGATMLADVTPATGPTVIVLGHEANGTPKGAFQFFDEVIEIPMFGVGQSLNVAVAGSLVAYKLAGLT